MSGDCLTCSQKFWYYSFKEKSKTIFKLYFNICGVDFLEQLLESINKVCDLLEQSNYTVVLTGAGISTEGDVPDSRNPGNWLWTMLDPDDFTIRRYKNDPASYYEAGAPFFSLLNQVEPNEVHLALTELQKRDQVKTIITQNIDGLHQKAGSKNVLEIRGTLKSASCLHCDRQVAIEDLVADAGEESFPPLCPKCGEPLKPDVVLVGEPPPPDYHKAKEEVQRADLMVIIGSSLHVSPDNQLPADCKNLIIINRTPTFYDRQAKVVINKSAITVMKLLLEELNKRE